MPIALLVISLLAGWAPAYGAERGARFQNLDEMVEALNLRSYFQNGAAPKHAVSVAICDNGFRGAREEIGRSLPANTKIVKVPQPELDPNQEEPHGFYMARIAWSIASLGGRDHRHLPKQFLLYNCSGYTNLEFAVNDAIRRGVEIMLFSEVWDYGGNFDGRGFINRLLTRALDAGILWINSSGNAGAATFNAPVRPGAKELVELAGGGTSLEIRCRKNPTKVCPLRATLSWNAFTDDLNAGTDKDLDFALFDERNQMVLSSTLRQQKKPGGEGTSVLARETIRGALAPGRYTMRVKDRSRNFSPGDRLRIAVQGEFLVMKDADRRESLLIPADNPRIISVGATDTERTGVSARLRKPELVTASLVRLSRTEAFKGTSNSAAMVFGGAWILKSHYAGLTREGLLKAAAYAARTNGPAADTGRGLSLAQLGFGPTGRGCFRPYSNGEALPDFVSYAESLGGQVVETTAGAKVLYPFDPMRVLPETLVRRRADDLVAMAEEGPVITGRELVARMPDGMIELAELPYGQRICSGNEDSWQAPPWSKPFGLPNLHGYTQASK